MDRNTWNYQYCYLVLNCIEDIEDVEEDVMTRHVIYLNLLYVHQLVLCSYITT